MAMLLGIAIFYARPAHQGTKRVIQPDGSCVIIRLVGDEYLHYNITDDGYSIVRRDDGAYVYAQIDAEGQLAPTALLAHDANERTMEERNYVESVGRLIPQPTAQMTEIRRRNQVKRARTLSQNRANLYDYSKFRGLVLLVEYNDCDFQYDDYAAIMEDMINADNYTGTDRTNIREYGIRCTGSIRDYFRDNSDGQFVPTFDVVGPVKVNRSQYYANGMRGGVQLMIDACTAADSLVNFRDYDVDGDGVVDMIYFIFAGLGSYVEGNDSRLLWPHQSDITYYRNVKKDGVYLGRYACSTELFGTTDWSVLEGIGTITHEFSHVLGLPDFYDTGNQYPDDQCVTPHDWSVMATGCDLNYGRTPCGLSLFERYALGFATPQILSGEGSFSLEALQSSNTGYRLYTPVKKESFYIENRQKTKWDAALPGHGMLIFRVDSTNNAAWKYDNTVNDNPNHPYYELIRAGGVKSNAYYAAIAASSDPFPGTRKVRTINNETTPNLKTWSGKPSYLGLRNIQENSGIITFDTYNVNVLTSIAFSSDSYKISVGSTLGLSIVCEPESALYTLAFDSDNKDVATVDDGGTVTALSEGIAHITVTTDNNLSATCTVTVIQPDEIPNIASFCAMNEGDDALLTLTDAQVLYVYEGDIYLRDASGSLILSGTNLNVSRNDVLNGSILGRLTYKNLMPQLTPAEGESEFGSLSISSGEAPQPTEIFGEELTTDRYADLVIVKGVTLVRDGGIFAVIGDHRVRLWNKFQIKSPKITLPSNITDKFYDITAIYGTDVVNGEVIDELYVLSSPVEGEEPDAISSPLTGKPSSTTLYNLYGQKVGKDFRGIIVENGRKFFQK
jgi:M6 family metalloprotease-like protein